MVNGEILEGLAAEDSGGYYRVLVTKGKRVSLVAVHRSDIYKISDRSGLQTVVYQRDPDDGMALTEAQMWDFILGCRAARQTYQPVVPMIAGGILGGASAVAGFWGLPAAPAYLALLSLKSPSPGEGLALPASVGDPDCFATGYRFTAQRLKIRKAAVTTLGGLFCVWILKVATTGLK